MHAIDSQVARLRRKPISREKLSSKKETKVRRQWTPLFLVLAFPDRYFIIVHPMGVGDTFYVIKEGVATVSQEDNGTQLVVCQLTQVGRSLTRNPESQTSIGW